MDPFDDSATGEVQENGPDQPEPPGLNPAWNDVLSVLPEQFHSVVTPHFQKWDNAANQRVEAANAQLKDYEQYDPFKQHGITQDEITQALRIMYEINNNPRNVYDALNNAHNFAGEPPVAEKSEDDSGAIPEDPRLNQLQEGLNLVSQIVLADAKAKEAAAADYEIETELKGLKSKYGEFNERYVLTMMMNGLSGDDAVQAYRSDIAQQNKSFAPNILSSNSGGAGLPSNAIDPAKLSSKETRSLVAQMLEQAARQR